MMTRLCKLQFLLSGELPGKVKLIYINPPYNTGNDGFRYNDSFNHLSRLVFMENRLCIARETLADNGFIAVGTDYNERAYLQAHGLVQMSVSA